MPNSFPVSVLTAEGELVSTEADMVVVPAADGEIGVLDRHVPLLAVLKPGPLRVIKGGQEDVFFVSGGFVDVGRDERDNMVVTVLADSGEHAADIDEAAAEEARRDAQRIIEQRKGDESYAEAVALLDRSVARIRVADLHRRRRPGKERRPPSA